MGICTCKDQIFDYEQIESEDFFSKIFSIFIY
jgi:hypothetical protein